MLLVIDVGNTNTVLGLYRGEELVHSWRLHTDKARTADEWAMTVHELFGLAGLDFPDVGDVIISCVVPPVLFAIEELCRSYFRLANRAWSDPASTPACRSSTTIPARSVPTASSTRWPPTTASAGA